MTREEAIEILKTLKPNMRFDDKGWLYTEQALEMAISALKQSDVSEYDKDHIWYKGGQYISLRRFLEVKAEAEKEPCEDAISRQAALDCFTATKLKKFDFILHAREEIKKLPSVQPKPKTGHWEKIVEEHKCLASDGTYTTTEYLCSECGAEPLAEYASDEAEYEFSNFCPNCGAKMESGDKE